MTMRHGDKDQFVEVGLSTATHGRDTFPKMAHHTNLAWERIGLNRMWGVCCKDGFE
jgi:hypothetical protein